MKKMKKGISLFLVILIAFSAVGCSSEDTAGQKGTKAQETIPNEDKNNEITPNVKWPKNVEIIVPASAGGDTDYNARLLADYLSKSLEPNFVVSNVSGNGGATGTRQVKEASNDGSSVLFYHSAFVVNELCGASDYGFDAYEFACIAAMNPGNAVTIRSDLGINTLEELIEYSKKHTGELKIAAQTGATSHAVALLLQSIGLEANIVDAGSASERLAALLGGHVDIILAAYGSIKDYVSEGTLVPLALDGMSDLEEADLLSISNLGYDISFPFYYFFAFPKGTDSALVKEFSNAVEEIVTNNKEYENTIYKTYYQRSTFYNAKDGLKAFDKVYEMLGNVDFSK